MAEPSDLLIGTWDLQTEGSNDVKKEFLLAAPSDSESIIGTDNRKLVKPSDYKTGGKYRAIVKLQMRFEHQSANDEAWAMGTGWLIQPDLLVTAGHCVYDWGNSLGRVVRVNAYIEYDGRDSVNDAKADVQFRQGLRVATTSGWLASSSNRTSDVSFVKLTSPFTGVESQTIKYLPTPVNGLGMLGIVGYPGDKNKLDLNKTLEIGAQMYEVWGETQWDLSTADKNMLKYTLSTGAGQSGAPVLWNNNSILNSIGTHTYGGSLYNSASPIAGTYGNIYNAYVQIVNDPAPKVIATKGSIEYMSADTLPNIEGFFDVLKDIGKIGTGIASTVLTAGSPFFGPVAGPLAAAAGAALGYVGPFPSDFIDPHGMIQRSILGEAVLQFLDLGANTAQMERIRNDMDKYYKQCAPVLYKIDPTVLGTLGVNVKADSSESLFGRAPQKIGFTVTEGIIDPSTTAFRTKLLGSSTVLGESFFKQDLGNIIVGGQQSPDPFVIESHTGLAYLSSIVSPTNLGVKPTLGAEDIKHLIDRAVLGQAALDAAIKENSSSPLPEGIFDTIKKVIQVIGPSVLQVLDKVLEESTPAITSLITNPSKFYDEKQHDV